MPRAGRAPFLVASRAAALGQFARNAGCGCRHAVIPLLPLRADVCLLLSHMPLMMRGLSWLYPPCRHLWLQPLIPSIHLILCKEMTSPFSGCLLMADFDLHQLSAYEVDETLSAKASTVVDAEHVARAPPCLLSLLKPCGPDLSCKSLLDWSPSLLLLPPRLWAPSPDGCALDGLLSFRLSSLPPASLQQFPMPFLSQQCIALLTRPRVYS